MRAASPFDVATTAFAVAMWCGLFTPLAGAAEPVTGWRGKGTGLWPEARVPLTWGRHPRGAMDGLRSQREKPDGADVAQAAPVKKGLIGDWLVVGPFDVDDATKRFDDDLLGGETTVEPKAGDVVAGKTWTAATATLDDFMVFGSAELPWLDLGKSFGFEKNRIGYAHAWLHSPRGGPVRIHAEHGEGLKIWLNGREIYRSPVWKSGLGFYTAVSRHELSHLNQPAPRIDATLKPGWNRVLLKLSSPSQEGHKHFHATVRFNDPPDVPCDDENIVWKSELPARSTGTPILVGDRIFLTAEPDELVCLDRATGKILWTAAVSPYEALPAAERAANPDYAKKVDPLLAALRQETDRAKRNDLRAAIQKTLEEIAPAKFKLDFDGHFESHFGIVGYTMATPVSDGRHVWVWCGNGVAACFDLDGKRRWITRLDVGALTYGSSPALADDMFVVYLNKLYGLDAETGTLKWTQPKVNRNVASLLAAKIDGHDVIVTQRGDVIRPSDGALLFRPRGAGLTGDTGWCPGVVLGDVLHQAVYGVGQVNLFDFAGRTGEKWAPETTTFELGDINKTPEGKWLDRWTAGSPLVWQGLWYQVDIYQRLYVVDLAERKLLYKRDLDLDGYTHYNALAVAASPTLLGGRIHVCDNQGTTLVLEPGREFKQLAKNRIGTQLDRTWPVPAQETLAYAPPITDGTRIYLRGERYLYCVGEK